MSYNLLREAWLPVVREDGRKDLVAVQDVVGGKSPVVDLSPPRADFRAALMEFLVGVFQTAMPPDQVSDWREWLEKPPSPGTIQKRLAPHEPYFNLFGERPRFMQDLTLSEKEKPARNGAGALLIDSPGGNTLKQGLDFFVKRGRVENLCPACAGAALFTLQAFAPSGGKGHRTSLRGGGPLSTLMDGTTLWEKVWSNVMPLSCRDAAVPPEANGLPGAVYPWAAKTRTSEKGEEIHPGDVHPLHAYWGMPRRILLEKSPSEAACDLCGEVSPLAVATYLTRPSGYNYGPTWRHPLTPYREYGDDASPLSIKGQANIAAYSHWLGLVYGQPAEQGGKRQGTVIPAACVRFARRQLRGRGINAAGYDMDNMKAVQWCEHAFPAFALNGEETEYREMVGEMVRAADQVRRNLAGALKDALVNEAGKNQAKIDATFFANASVLFWSSTESAFFAQAKALASVEDLDAQDGLYQEWGRVLDKAAMDLFDEMAMSGRLPSERLERCVEARRRMRNYNRKYLKNNEFWPEGGER
ncbi:type I-E CRISPR-associated protein Cse1/CasA [Pseudodesulfovibrio indicus]|uniref:type I-E CRISPR-associated protein Cse1/CasA n=1 Tax=Pseudodesulfovibrio indicus TaxID=1716143 RepID=UPI00292EDAAF|nr:type I-E CRISPR-associated protein Cse1/CasA [Pseudodesulfovibrio indicus]